MKYKALILTLLAAGALQAQTVHYRIQTDQPRQTIDCFSASDGWSMQHIGLWSPDVQNQAADWLFSTENDSKGQPKGIGLSLWRFNVGAGSQEQGDASQIGSRWTRGECFLNADGTYNWNKQQGQRNFLRLAKERGVNRFLAFLNKTGWQPTPDATAHSTCARNVTTISSATWRMS